MRASDGIVRLARVSGVPILPATFGAHRRKVLPSWDRFVIPWPFTRGVLVWGEPITVARDADDAAVERARVQVEDALNALTEEADRLVGQSPIEPAAIAEVYRLLRPGGVIGLSDVTVETGSLPPELDGTVGMMLCLTDALPADGYQRLLERSGFITGEPEDLTGEVVSLLADLRGKLALGAAVGMPSSELTADLAESAPGLLDRVEQSVSRGQIGYWLYVGRNPH